MSSGSIFANTENLDETLINESETVVLRTKCQIVGSNVYTWCIDHGYSIIQASSIANAAETECKRVSIAE